jgi:hypothetical protein
MKTTAVIALAIAVSGAWVLAQEKPKPVPKDSVRVFIPGCSAGYIFTAGPRSEDQPGRADIPEGMHLRMNGPKQMLSEIKAHEGSMIEITGLMKKGQRNDGVTVGGVRISPGQSPTGNAMTASPTAGQIMIDVESWRPLAGDCPTR